LIGKNKELSPELEELRRLLEWNRACATEADERGQSDTCYHTDIIKLEAALKAAEKTEVNHVKLD
jgi:hypothetical protein